jgi:hypothetical protein
MYHEIRAFANNLYPAMIDCMKRKIGLISILIIIGLLAIIVDSLKTQNKPPLIKTSSATTISNEPGIFWYTSPSLGLRFKYATKDPSISKIINGVPNAQIIEEGRRISNTAGGSISVFDKRPEVSITEVVQSAYPSCKVEATTAQDQPLDQVVKIYLPDLSSLEFGPQPLQEFAGDRPLTEKDTACLKYLHQAPLYFAGSSKFPDRYISINRSTQAVEAMLYKKGDKITYWMDSIEFIPK